MFVLGTNNCCQFVNVSSRGSASNEYPAMMGKYEKFFTDRYGVSTYKRNNFILLALEFELTGFEKSFDRFFSSTSKLGFSKLYAFPYVDISENENSKVRVTNNKRHRARCV